MNFKKKIIDIAILVCYIGLIYSTLSIAPTIYASLKKVFGPSLSALTNIFIALILLSSLRPFYNRLKHKSVRARLGIAIVLVIYALLITYLVPLVVERIHLLEYGFLSYLALRVFKEIRSRDMAYLYVVAILVSVGYFDEVIQKFLPNRVYDTRDVILNVLSGLLGLALARLLTFPENKI